MKCTSFNQIRWGLGIARSRCYLPRTKIAAANIFTKSGARAPKATDVEGEELVFTISESGQVHLPPRLRLPSGDSASFPELCKQLGIQPTNNSNSSGKGVPIGILGFGLSGNFIFNKAYDTLCIVHMKNRMPLEGHAGYWNYLGPRLRKVNSENVEVLPIAGKGLGLVAKRDIPRGQTIIRERPLLMCMANMPTDLATELPHLCMQRMTAGEKAAYFALFDCQAKAGDDMAGKALGILLANNFPTSWSIDDEEQCAVFDCMSRANHSCSPNAVYEWHDESFCGIFRSTYGIKKGTKVTVAATPILAPSSQRKAHLQNVSSFVCACPACALPAMQQAESDHRREILRTRIADLQDPRASHRILQEGYGEAFIEQTLSMLDAEGLGGKKAEVLAAFATFECSRANSTRSGDYKLAIHLAERSIQELRTLGIDEKHRVWSSMEKILKGDDTAQQGTKTEPSNEPKQATAKIRGLFNMTLDDMEKKFKEGYGADDKEKLEQLFENSPAMRAKFKQSAIAAVEKLAMMGCGPFTDADSNRRLFESIGREDLIARLEEIPEKKK